MVDEGAPGQGDNWVSFDGRNEEKQLSGSMVGPKVKVEDKTGQKKEINILVHYSISRDHVESLVYEYGSQKPLTRKIAADIRSVTRKTAKRFTLDYTDETDDEYAKAIQQALRIKWADSGISADLVNASTR